MMAQYKVGVKQSNVFFHKIKVRNQNKIEELGFYSFPPLILLTLWQLRN